MAVVGELAVNVVARTEKFIKGMRTARKQASTFKADLTKAIGIATGAFAGITAAANRFVDVLRTTGAELDTVAKAAHRLGIAADQLSGLQFAAGLSGVSSNTLNMALQRMTRRVAEAAQGTGEAVNALKELGLSAQSLMRLPLEQQLYAVAGAMESVSQRADQIRLAMKLFDSEGVALVNMLDSGEVALRRFAAEAQALGGAFSDDQLAKVEAMNDAFSRLQTVMDSLKKEITIRLAPETERTLSTLTTILQIHRHHGPRLKPGAGPIIAGIAGGPLAMAAGALFKAGSITVNPVQRANERQIKEHDQQLKEQLKIQRELERRGNIMREMRSGQPPHAEPPGEMAGIGRWFDMGQPPHAEPPGELKATKTTEATGRLTRQANTILEKGTREAFAALRANMRPHEDKKIKLDQDRNKLLDQIAEKIMVPPVAN